MIKINLGLVPRWSLMHPKRIHDKRFDFVWYTTILKMKGIFNLIISLFSSRGSYIIIYIKRLHALNVQINQNL